jgi:hypothetical protein
VTFVIFGVGLGNLGRFARQRVRGARWAEKLNRGLMSRGVPIRVSAAYGHTGNFIVRGTATRVAARDALSDVLSTSCVVMTLSELGTLVELLEPQTRKGMMRNTPGVVMQVRRTVVNFRPWSTCRGNYYGFKAGSVLAFKRDRLTGTGTLDPNQRGGGWGALAGDVAKCLQGQWTARSLRTLRGTLRLGLKIESRAESNPKIIMRPFTSSFVQLSDKA